MISIIKIIRFIYTRNKTVCEGFNRQVTDREGRIILEERYLQYDKWEEIAGEMGYTVRQIFRIHDAALMEIRQR